MYSDARAFAKMTEHPRKSTTYVWLLFWEKHKNLIKSDNLYIILTLALVEQFFLAVWPFKTHLAKNVVLVLPLSAF